MIALPSLQDVRLVEFLQQGQVGIMPTDTIYGLVATATNKDAVARLYRLKQREQKPGTVLAASTKQLILLGLDEQTVQAVAHFWPNPLSIIIPASKMLHYLDQGLGDLAVRIPRDEQLRHLLSQTGPLLTSSANHPGGSPANNILEAQRLFGEQVDWFVDGGDRSNHPPSTVARYSGDRLHVLRPGAVTIDKTGSIIV